MYEVRQRDTQWEGRREDDEFCLLVIFLEVRGRLIMIIIISKHISWVMHSEYIASLSLLTSHINSHKGGIALKYYGKPIKQ